MRHEQDAEDVAQLAADMADPRRRTADVIDRYYTLCIPFYREFLGAHWHTGYYADTGPIGPQDQLRMTQVIAESVAITDRDHVLDVGCGMGGPACQIAGITGAHVLGITPNATQLALAKAHAQDAGCTQRVRFGQGWADALPCADESMDVVLFFESACHFPDRLAFFKEAFRVLKPGGRLAGEDWLASDGLSDADLARHVAPICDTWAIPSLGTCASYAAGMQDAGFHVEDAVDMRHEMALSRGFIVEPREHARVRMAMRDSRDPIRQLIMQGLIKLGQAMAAGAFTVGRFKVVKPLKPLKPAGATCEGEQP